MIAHHTNGKRYVLGLSGKDSLAAALLLKAHSLEVWERLEIFSTLTGADYPETLDWLGRLPILLEKPITFIDGNIFEAINKKASGDAFFLPSIHVRYCTRDAKIKPFQEWIGKSSVTLFTGIRADENRVGYKGDLKVTSLFPLCDHEYTLGKVWALILGLPLEFQPPTFYWASLHDLCRTEWERQLPLFPSLDSFVSPIQRRILFSGRSRPNCFFCFNQRQYEIVWLYESHPNLFEKMASMEKLKYTWVKDFPLSELNQQKRDLIKLKRAKAIVKLIATQSFGVELDGFESMPSCGLFCGK